MSNLLSNEFLKASVDAHGSSVIEWSDRMKDLAVREAMTSGDSAELNSCLADFWNDRSAVCLYSKSNKLEAIEEFKNNVWAALEHNFQDELDDFIESMGDA